MLELNTVNKATSQHTRSFMAMCKFGDRYIGASPNGLSEINGFADGDTAINAIVKSGDLDLGTPRLKWFRYLYFKVLTEGLLKVSLYCDGVLANELYVDSNYGAQQTVQVEVPTSARGLYWSWKLENEDGAFFALYSVWSLPVFGRFLKSTR